MTHRQVRQEWLHYGCGSNRNSLHSHDRCSHDESKDCRGLYFASATNGDPVWRNHVGSKQTGTCCRSCELSLWWEGACEGRSSSGLVVSKMVGNVPSHLHGKKRETICNNRCISIPDGPDR